MRERESRIREEQSNGQRPDEIGEDGNLKSTKNYVIYDKPTNEGCEIGIVATHVLLEISKRDYHTGNAYIRIDRRKNKKLKMKN